MWDLVIRHARSSKLGAMEWLCWHCSAAVPAGASGERGGDCGGAGGTLDVPLLRRGQPGRRGWDWSWVGDDG